MVLKLTRRESGVTIVESTIATVLVGMFIAGLFIASSHIVGLLRTGKDNVSANQLLHDRVENMRIANWLQITDTTYLRTNLMATPSDSVTGLNRPVETIRVSAYPPVPGSVPAVVVRQNGAATTVSSNSTLKDQRMVRVDIQLKWSGFPRNRPRTRETTAIIAKGGISK